MLFNWIPKHDKDKFNKDLLAKVEPWQLLLSILGLASSLWTIILHVQLHNADGPLVCDVSETINCTKIIGSEYGELFQIPLGAFGMSYFAIALGLTILPIFARISKRYLAFYRLVAGTVGVVVALSMAFIAYFVLNGVCEACTLVQLSTIIYFIFTVFDFKRNQDTAVFADPSAFSRMVIVAVLLSTPPLAAGYISNTYLLNYIEKDSSSDKEVNVSKTAISPEVAKYSKDEDFKKGNDNAPIVLVEFTDFECPYCQTLHSKLHSVQENIGEENLLIVFRNWPLKYHKHSRKLALAGRCIGSKGKFWEFADWAFSTAKENNRDPEKKAILFSDSAIKDKAITLGIDEEYFTECIKNKATEVKIEKDIKDANEFGAKGTPFILINGKPYKRNWLKKGLLEKDLRKLLPSKN